MPNARTNLENEVARDPGRARRGQRCDQSIARVARANAWHTDETKPVFTVPNALACGSEASLDEALRLLDADVERYWIDHPRDCHTLSGNVRVTVLQSNGGPIQHWRIVTLLDGHPQAEWWTIPGYLRN